MKHLFLLIILLCVSFPSFADELRERKKIENAVVHMFEIEQFDELSDIANDYLKKEARTSSGLWKLTLYYAGLDGYTNKNVIHQKYWDNAEAKALRWIKAKPNSPAAHLTYATIMINRARMYKSNNWPTEERIRNNLKFQAQMRRALDYLNRNKQVAANDPHWYKLRLYISGKTSVLSKNYLTELINGGSKKFPNYYPLYFAAVDILTSSDIYTIDDIEILATSAVKFSTQKEKQGLYSRIYWYASQRYFGFGLFENSAVNWELMSTSIDDVLALYSDQWNINNFALFACLAGDAPKTAELISKIEGEPIKSAWRKTEYFHQCKDWSNSDTEA